MGKSQTKPQSALAKSYLVCYNTAQFVGWSYMFSLVVKHFTSGGSIENLWDHVGRTVVIFQNAALLEIVHVALGLVRSDLTLTTAQVMSRVLMVSASLLATPTARQSYGLPMILCAWCPTEVVRYLFYSINLIGKPPSSLLWIRYTFFYFLYPLGVSGELLCLYAAQSYAAKTKMLSVELPNALNVTFSYQYFLVTVMLLYIPFFPQLYLYMHSQRKKVLLVPKLEKKVS